MAGPDPNGLQVQPVPAGVGGHKAPDLSQRVQADVLDHQPEVMTLSCGVNDVWHGRDGVPLPRLQEHIHGNLDAAERARVRVLTASMIGEELDNKNHLDPDSARRFSEV